MDSDRLFTTTRLTRHDVGHFGGDLPSQYVGQYREGSSSMSVGPLSPSVIAGVAINYRGHRTS